MEKTNKKKIDGYKIWTTILCILLAIIIMIAFCILVYDLVQETSRTIATSIITMIIFLSLLPMWISRIMITDESKKLKEQYLFNNCKVENKDDKVLFFYKDLLLIDSEKYNTGMRAFLKIKPINNVSLFNKIALWIDIYFGNSKEFKHIIRESVHHDGDKRYHGKSIKTWLVKGPIINIFYIDNSILFIEMLVNKKNEKDNTSHSFIRLIRSIVELYELSYVEGDIRVISNIKLDSVFEYDTTSFCNTICRIEGVNEFDGLPNKHIGEMTPANKDYLKSLSIKMENDITDDLIKTDAPEPSTDS